MGERELNLGPLLRRDVVSAVCRERVGRVGVAGGGEGAGGGGELLTADPLCGGADGGGGGGDAAATGTGGGGGGGLCWEFRRCYEQAQLIM